MKSLRRLECFVAVAEELHFRKAGDRLNLTQPALSQQIRELERELGVRLFDRDRRSVALTDAAEILLPAVRAALAAIQEAEASIAAAAQQRDRRLRLGYIEYLNLPFLIPTLRALQDRRPEIEIEQIELHPSAVVQALIDREIDIGVAFPPFDHPDLAARPALSGRWMIALPETHALARSEEVGLDRLAAEDLVLFARRLNPKLYDYVIGKLQAAGVDPKIRYTVSQALAGPKYVQDGLGLFIHASYVLDDLPHGVVRQPLAEFPEILLSVVWRGDRRTAAVRAFLDAMKTVVNS